MIGMPNIYNKYELPDENGFQEISEVEEVLEFSSKSRQLAAFLALAGYHELYLGLSKNIFGTFNMFKRWNDYFRLRCGEEFFDGEGRPLR